MEPSRSAEFGLLIGSYRRFYGLFFGFNQAEEVTIVHTMTRANRRNGVGVDGGIWHLTHRCHNRAFVLKFAHDQEAYRHLVWQLLKSYAVSVLDYSLTSNHMHLLVEMPDRREVSGFMQEASIPYGQKRGLKNAANGLK